MPDDNTYSMTTPTLMIGLGGLGCTIVQSVYAGLIGSQRTYTRAHVMDTDVAELKDPRYEELYNSGWLTQLSPALTVQECVQRLGVKDTATQWFPPMGFGSLGHKQMAKGAAQVRAVSRLALLDTINSDRIDALNRNLDGLLEKRPSDFKVAVRVLIVNSIAGGTGSGSFLQIALYVREYLRVHHGRSNVSVRGFIVMPEVFIRNGDYPAADLQANVKANGYAALKEIDAIVRLRAGLLLDPGRSHLAPLYPVALEYVPGRKTADEVTAGAPPFDVVTLFDFTGSDGSNLANKFNYIAQVEDAMRFHLFSPLEGRGGIDSQEDNLANTHLASGDRSRYAGCGTANLEYPFDDLVDYAALRWATDGISAAWMELDELVNEEVWRVEQARREGNYLEMPDPHARYCELLRDKSEGQRPSPFYRSVYRDAHLLDGKGEPVAPKHAEFWRAIEAKLRSMVKAAVQEKEGELSVLSLDALNDPENVVAQVQQSEDGLSRFAKEVERRIQPIGVAVAKEAVWKPFDDEVDCVRDDDAQLNTWVLARGTPMHPLAVRYFLGEARLQLTKRLGEIRHELLKVSKRVDGYAASWDDSSTEEVETASDIAMAKRNRRFSKVRGILKDFAEEYRARIEAQRRDIERRAELFALKEASELLLGYLEDFADVWRSWFLRLDIVRRHARDEIELLECKHDDSDERTRVYVHASAGAKRSMWDNERAAFASKEFPPEISREMYLALYREKGKQYRQSIPPSQGASWVEGLFRDAVLTWCGTELRGSPAFDMDVSSAIKAELRLMQQLGVCASDDTEEAALVRYLNQLDALATPWVQAPGKGQKFEFLCMHPGAESQWPPALLNLHAANRRVNDGFSRYKISKVTLLQGLCATDLLSMTGTHATYRSAYDARVQAARALPPKAITPHLDFRWDSPAFLLEPDDQDQERAMKDLYRATMLTLADIHASIPSPVFVLETDMQKHWYWSPHRAHQAPLPGVDGKSLPATTFGLVEALAVNYGLVTEIVRAAAEREARDRATPDGAPLIGALGLLVDALAKVADEAPLAQVGLSRQAALLLALFDEVRGIYHRAMGAPNAARVAAERVLGGVWTRSLALQGDPDGRFAAQVRRAIDQALARP